MGYAKVTNAPHIDFLRPGTDRPPHPQGMAPATSGPAL